MIDSLNQNEIDALLAEIELELKRKKITQIKPREIALEKNITERANLQKRFNDIKSIYVKPLQELLISNKKNYVIDLSDLSIVESVVLLRNELIKIGYNPEQLLEFVPKTEEEVGIIMLAKENGFEDNELLLNIDRVNAASEYLNHIDIKRK